MTAQSFPSSVKTQKTVVITSTQSWTAPNGVTSIETVLCGGGSGGTTQYPGRGGAGSVFYDVLTVVPGTSYTITIGAGGSGGGGTGGTSSIGSLLSATGATPTVAAGLGGHGGVGLFVGTAPATNGSVGAYGYGGGGGGGGNQSYNAGGGSSGGGFGGNSSTGQAAKANSGSGGGGGNVDGSAGGAGGSGICIIKYWE